MKKLKTPKKPGRTRNWSQYNVSLKNRGSITFWFCEEMLGQWYDQSSDRGRGRPRLYSNVVIELMLTLKYLYSLPYRQTQGFTESLLKLMKVERRVPSYTQLQRRSATLEVELAAARTTIDANRAEAIHVVVDSTGLKVYGEGEWKVRGHGVSKRRTWMKMHLAVDSSTSEILSTVITPNSVADCEVFEDLIDGVDEPIEQISADGAYDKSGCYDAIEERAEQQQQPIAISIPPQRNAKIRRHGNANAPPHPRDENLRQIRAIGRKQWKIESGYHRRSLAETAMFRFKTIFSPKLSSRRFATQATEVFIKCSILNKMLQLGKPEYGPPG